jgi:hypothetical protein
MAEVCGLTAAAHNSNRCGIKLADAADHFSYGIDGRRGARAGGLRHGRQPFAGAGVEFMRNTAFDPPPPEPPPDVRQLVRKNLDSVFVAAANPRQVRVAPPRHAPIGPGWTACVRAELTSVTGGPLGAETYRITISNGAIIDRRRAEVEDNCASENYEPI